MTDGPAGCGNGKKNPPLQSIYQEPGSPYRGGQLLHNLILFGRVCKALGMDITPNLMLDAAAALTHIRLGEREEFYHALRALMVTRQADLAPFAEAFALFWRRPTEGWTKLNVKSLGEERQKKQRTLPPSDLPPADEDDRARQIDETLLAILPTFSPHEALRQKAFADMTELELEQARQLLSRLPASLALRRTRRFRPGGHDSADLRAALRQSARHAGEVLTIPQRQHREKPRPVVLICDISGSMERYTRILLHFMHTLSDTLYRVESFVFSTRLTRITHPIRHRSVDEALLRIGTRVKDWGGGTQTGAALRTFNYEWARRVLGRGAIVLLITDGWDRGDIPLLSAEAERLQRSCWRFLWLNPLLGAPAYEPLTRGAQALLPLVDEFLPVRNLDHLAQLARELGRIEWRVRKTRAARPTALPLTN
ncbi:MAG: VWA domain-containing protein [Chloroflexi bacterium]|nr:VWA domain-containing protein [Chloroflexota bacterium]